MSTYAAQSPLGPSITSLRTSTALLQSSLDILSTGTRDLPRLRNVLQQTRHFELAPSSALAAAQADVLAELVPEVERLLARVEKVVEGRERREEWLRARWTLGEGRLGREAGSFGQQERRPSSGDAGVAGRDDDKKKVDAAKAKRLRQKKERLSYAVERLQLQANQKQRQLRMSMAAQESQASQSGPTRTEDDLDDAEDDF